jgi:hypothetical protein
MGENVSGRGKCVAGSIDRPATCFLAAGRTFSGRSGDSEVGAQARWGGGVGGVLTGGIV